MSEVLQNLKYAASHEWAALEGEDSVRVGISDFAQSQLGDLVFVELPEIGEELTAGEQCAVVESVKAASDLFAPVSGEVLKVNSQVIDEPELVNDEPYTTWLFCVKARDISELDGLMNADNYSQMIEDA